MYQENLYKAKAVAWGWTETSDGNPQFWMTFDVLGVVDCNNLNAPPTPAEQGSGRWVISPTTVKAVDSLIRTVQSLGYDRDDLLALDPDAKDAFNFEGVEFIAQAKRKEYQGQLRIEWSVYVPTERANLPAALNAN